MNRIPKTAREVYAEALRLAERELREAQEGLDGSDAAAARYARAREHHDKLTAAAVFAGSSKETKA